MEDELPAPRWDSLEAYLEEADMACPKCYRPWLRVEGNQLICQCGYSEEIKERPLSYDELLSERNKLRQRVKELEQQQKLSLEPPE